MFCNIFLYFHFLRQFTNLCDFMGRKARKQYIFNKQTDILKMKIKSK